MAMTFKWAAAFVLAASVSTAASAEDAKAVPVSTNASAVASSSDTISRAAAVYGTFHSDVGELKSQPLQSARDITTALDNLGGQNAGELSNGWLAYSALVASQSPEFRAAVRDIEGFYGRDRVMLGFRNDMGYARTLEGGGLAVNAALTATDADSRRLSSAASYVKEQAYTLQGSSWAKARIGNTDGIVTKLNSASKAGRAPSATVMSALQSPSIDGALTQAGGSSSASLWDGVMDAATGVRFPSLRNPSLTARRASIRQGREQIADRIATLAAYRVMGVDDETAGQISAAMADTETSSCIRRSQLNLQQCVAAAHQQYELPFCIGEHALRGV
ncbi:MAG: hypothetical protein AAGJ29_09120 [Pseudomonadota bacterium]